MTERETDSLPADIAVLEHFTGPLRGTVTWLNGVELDISLSPNRHLRVSEARPGETPESLAARLRRVGEYYEIEAAGGRPLWVNGLRVASQRLKDRDMIEFGPVGPLSRFCLYRDGRALPSIVGDIFADSIAYIRASRRPMVGRLGLALGEGARRLTYQTTVLFRMGVVLALVLLALLVYQQFRLDILMQERIESGATRLESFVTALTRAREEALTPQDLEGLREDLGLRMQSNAERLAALERRSLAIGRVISGSVSSIVFLQGAYGFRETGGGRWLRHALDDRGRPLVSPYGQPLLTLEGEGPVAERQFTGTGFVAGDGDLLVTNRHIALPWEKDANVALMASQDLVPEMVRLLGYLPGRGESAELLLLRASEKADLAVLSWEGRGPSIPGLPLAAAAPTAGDEVIVMGYPTGLKSLLAQSGEAFIAELQQTEDIDFWRVAKRLAEAGHIAPLASRGIVAQVGQTAIVYDAETTLGGSGGPVLGLDGAVIAVNVATMPEYGGSNLGVPVALLRALLAIEGTESE